MSGTKNKGRSQPASLDGNDLYAAEAILDKKVDESGKELYLIKWVGWADKWNTWEPLENISSDSLINEFEEFRKKGIKLKGLNQRSVASASTPTNLLKKRGRGRPSGARNKSTSSQKKLKTRDDSDKSNTHSLRDKTKNKTEDKSEFERKIKENTRRLSRSSSQEQSSQSNSANNSRRSSIVSISGRKSRRNSFIESTAITLTVNNSSADESVPQKSSSTHRSRKNSSIINENKGKDEESLRGRADPIFDDTTRQEIDSEPSPKRVSKSNNDYSDREFDSDSSDSYSESFKNRKICDKFNCEPEIVLERLPENLMRLPKILIKRKIFQESDNESDIKESYEIMTTCSEVNVDESHQKDNNEGLNKEGEQFKTTTIELSTDNEELSKVDEQLSQNIDKSNAVNEELNKIDEQLSQNIDKSNAVNEELIAEELNEDKEVENRNEEDINKDNEQLVIDTEEVIEQVIDVEMSDISNENVVENEGLTEENVCENVYISEISKETVVEVDENEVKVSENITVNEVIEEERFAKNDGSGEEKLREEIHIISESVIISDGNREESIEDIVVVEQTIESEEVQFMETNTVPKDPSIDSQSDNAIQKSAIEHNSTNTSNDSNSSVVETTAESNDISVVETSTELIKMSDKYIDLELTFNEDIILDNIDNNTNDNNDNETNDIMDQNIYKEMFSPVSEDDFICDSQESIEVTNEKESQNLNEEVAKSEESDSSKNESVVDKESDETIEKMKESLDKNLSNDSCDENTNKREDNLIETEDMSSLDDNKKVCETLADVPKAQDSQELDFSEIVSEEEIYDDSQSQDSQLSEARSTPQPKTQWTPQSDYIEERVEQQINYSIDFTSRIETNSPLLPSPPSVTVAQPLPQTSTPPLSSQSPTKRRSTSVEQPLHIDVTEPQNKDKSNDELQTTSAIIVDVILSPSQDSSVGPQLSPNTETTDQNNKNDDKSAEKSSPIPSPELIVRPVSNVSPPPRPSAPPPPSMTLLTECSTADASHLPLLEKTNHPSLPQPITTRFFNPAKDSFNESCHYRPQVIHRQTLVPNESMRIPIPQMSSPHQQVIQRLPPNHSHVIQGMPSRQLNIPQTQRPTHQFITNMIPYPPSMPTNFRQTSGQQFSPTISPDIQAMRPSPGMRPECSLSNRPSIPLQDMRMRSEMTASMRSELPPNTRLGMPTDMRMRSEIPENIQMLGPQVRHQPIGQLIRHPSDQHLSQMRSMSGQLSPHQIHYNSRPQRIISPYDYRHNIQSRPPPPKEFYTHLEQKLRGLPSNQMPYPYGHERMSAIPPTNIPIAGQSSVRQSLDLSNRQKKITVEPKQSEVRDKLRQTTHHFASIGDNFPFDSRREPQHDVRQLDSYQRTAYFENMSNKEREVQEFLEGMANSNCFNRSETRSVIRSGRKSNSPNIQSIRSNRSDTNSPQILERLLSQSPFNNEQNFYKQLNNNNERQSDSIDEVRSLSRSSSKSGHKDILTEAMVEITDEPSITIEIDDKVMDALNDGNEENIVLISDETPTHENPTPEEGQCYYILADENAGEFTNDQLVELIQSQGLQVVESDSQEEPVIEQQKESNKGEEENSLQLNDKSVENKSSDEVQNDKTNESNGELLQIFLIDDNKDNESNDLIVGNDSVEGMEWSLVVDESDGQLESNSTPIIVQLTEELSDKNNESLVNSETARVQHKDNDSIDISINQTKTVLQKDDSMAVEVEQSVETVPKDSSDDIQVEIVSKDSSVDIEVETVPKDSSVDIEVETVPKESSVDMEVETVPKDSFVDMEVETVPKDSSVDIEVESVSKENSVDIEVENVSKENSVDIEVETVSKESSVDIEVETVSKDSPVDIEVETVSRESSVDIEVETVPKDSSVDIEVESVSKESSVDIEVKTVSKDSSVDIEIEDIQQSVPELIKYVSMPTFCFDDNQNEPKSKSTEVEDNRSDEEMIEKSLNNDKQTDEAMIREEVEEDLSSEEIIVDVLSEQSSPKETVNEENKDSQEMTITDNQNTDNPKIVLNEELINSRVQHPVVSSSVEDFLPNSPLSSSSLSSNCGKIVAQKTLGGDKNSALFVSNSPLSTSYSSREVIAPTTTIVISHTDDNSLNNDQINDKIIHKNHSDIEVPQNTTNDQSIDKVFNANINNENRGKKRKKKLDLSRVPPKKKMSEEEMNEFLHLLRSHKNGFDQGWTPKEIIGINSLNNQLVFLVKWTNDKQTIVLSEVANQKCPQMVIQFYEKHINWDSDTD